MARGGRRAGRPGEQYPNRTDLALAPRTAPVKIPGQGYGEQAAQVRAQQAVPSAAPPPPRPAPDIMGRLTAPTERPNEPFQTGLPTGPGPGPEVLGMRPDIGRLADYLPVLEVLASKPDTTQDMRNFVRLVRANAPLGSTTA